MARYREGKTTLLVPPESLTERVPPTTPAFFNPAARVNRDVAVCLAAAVRARTFCDAMSGVGSRGVRAAKEVDGLERAYLVDINGEAMGLAKRSARLNGVLRRCRFVVEDAAAFLHSRYGKDMKFDWVDLDPFGSPARQIPAVLSATRDGGVAAFTATDTAVLCGVYPKVAARRYGGMPLNNHFHHETGIRLLLGAIARQAAVQELGVRPLAAHATRHYIRVALKVEVGAARADRSLAELGYVGECQECRRVSATAEGESRCSVCGGKVKSAGPLWTGTTAGEEQLNDAEAQAVARGMPEAARLLGGLRGVDGYPPWSFDLDVICSRLGVPTVPERPVVEALAGKGFDVMKQPFEVRGIKTKAPYDEVEEAVRGCAAGNDYQLRRAVE